MHRLPIFLTALLVLSSGCSSGGNVVVPSPTPDVTVKEAWWKPLISLVPRDFSGREIWLTNHEALTMKAGDPPLGPSCNELIASGIERDATSQDDSTYWSNVILDSDSWDVLGFDRCHVKIELGAYHDPGDFLAVYGATTPLTRTRDALLANRYAQSSQMGADVFEIDVDYGLDARRAYRRSGLNRVALVDSLVVHAPATEIIDASLAARTDNRGTLEDTVEGSLIHSLDPFDSAVITRDVSFTLREQVERFTGEGATPEQIARTTLDLIAPYADSGWGRLPRPDGVGFAYLRVDTPEGKMRLALAYRDQREAEVAKGEIARRLETYMRYADNLRVCENTTAGIKREGDTFVVVATCDSRSASSWKTLSAGADWILLVEKIQ